MVISSIKSRLHWRSAKSLRSTNPDESARQFVLAVKASPANEERARRAVGMLVADGRVAEARSISAARLADDPVAYWRHYDSYLQELESGNGNPAPSGQPFRITLLNDTDWRLNIGCRLTSQGLKGVIRQAFPGAHIASHGFRFPAFRHAFSSDAVAAEGGQGHDSMAQLEERVSVAYGPGALEAIRQSDFVILQPEGSLDTGTPLDGLRTFFAPLVLAQQLGKPTAIVNGTIPVYEDERTAFVQDLLSRLPAVAARDELSAERYGVSFIPDAALLYPPPVAAPERDGCLVTTGARNSADEDKRICRAALEVCRATGLRPVVLTHAASRFEEFEPAVRSMNGVFAETASLEVAARTLSTCRLHVGARYHMAIFCIVARVPSLLFDVATYKNQWLGRYSPLIRLVAPDQALVPEARHILNSTFPPAGAVDDISQAYADFLTNAARPDGR